MNYKTFVADLKDNKIKSLCLVYGKEKYLVRWAVESICHKYIQKELKEFDLTLINGPDADVNTIINSCETLPILSEKRTVIIDDFQLIEGGKSKNIAEGDEKALTAYFEAVPDTCILMISCGEKIDKRKKLTKAVLEKGSVYEFTKLETADLKKWIIKRFKTAGKDIDPAALSKLIENSGYYDSNSDYNLYNLENDIKKILFYADEKNKITGADIDGNVSGNVDRNVFALIDLLSKGKKGDTFRMVSDMLLYGESEYGIIAMIYRQFEHILSIKQMKEKAMSFDYMKKQLGIPDFAINKLVKLSDSYSEEKLKSTLVKVFDADKNIKTGKLDSKLALEMLIANI